MAVIAGEEAEPFEVFDEAGDGVVEHSVPAGDKKGAAKNFCPSIAGHESKRERWIRQRARFRDGWSHRGLSYDQRCCH
jgi:hypothetical protein